MGVKFYFAGNNTYYAGLISDRSQQDNIFLQNKNKGVKVMRIWAFNNGTSGSIQPSLGTYNETALRNLDYAVKKAADNGIKLSLPFVNYWPDYNGMQWYVNQKLGSGTIIKFYTDSGVKQAYKNYINMLVNRTNYYTGVKYRDYPAIFSWELGNEPRNPEDQTGNTLYNWVNEMAAYIKSLDPNHLLTTGEEGFKVNDDIMDKFEKSGVDFVRNIGNANIDYATIHLYPDNWQVTLEQIDAMINDRTAIARGIGKPIVMAEYGRKASDRDTVFTRWHNLGTNSTNDMDGFMPWQMEVSPWDGNYGFTFTSSTATLIANLAALQNSKCVGSGTPTPTPTAGPTPTPGSGTMITEAETGTLSGTVVSTSRAGYSGSGYVTSFDNTGDALTVNVNVASAGSYNLKIRYASEFGDKPNYVYVNGNNLGEKNFTLTTTFTELNIGAISLNAGNNTIKVEKSWGWIDVDYIKVEGGSTATPTPTPTPTPSATATPTPTPSGVTIKANFENTTESWTGLNIAAGPWPVTEWKYNGSYSLKADVNLSNNAAYELYKVANDNFSGKSQFKAVVRHATWGTTGGMTAKIYIKTGSGWTWYDGGAVAINSGTGGTVLTLNLPGVANLDQVKEYGVEYRAGSSGASGSTSIYIDYVTIQ